MREAQLVSLEAREPPSGDRGVLERPPPGLGRGVIPAPAAAIIGLTLGLVLFCLGYYALRLRRARRR
jgi:hypothetical protein